MAHTNITTNVFLWKVYSILFILHHVIIVVVYVFYTYLNCLFYDVEYKDNPINYEKVYFFCNGYMYMCNWVYYKIICSLLGISHFLFNARCRFWDRKRAAELSTCTCSTKAFINLKRASHKMDLNKFNLKRIVVSKCGTCVSHGNP